MSYEDSDSAFVGLGPIPLRDYQMQSPDQFEDILRKMKTQKEQSKLQMKEKEIKDQRSLLEQREQMKRLMEKNSNKNFTYDYDGKIIIAKKGSVKNVVNQENIVGISYKIGATTNVVKKINQDQPQQITPKIVQNKEQQAKKSLIPIHPQNSSTSNHSQPELLHQPSSYEMMVDNLKPSQGVVFKGSKGEVIQGEGYSSQQSQFDFFDTSKNPNDIKRMTKKDYDEFIKTSGNYSRNDTYKPRRYTTNSQLNPQNKADNNFDDILDGINYSQIQPIEEQQTEEELQTLNSKKKLQNNILSGVSPIVQNKSSFKLAGINSIQRQSSNRVATNANYNNNNNNQEFDNHYGVPQTTNGYQANRMTNLYRNSSQIQPKKNKAGNIQVADQEKLRAMLL